MKKIYFVANEGLSSFSVAQPAEQLPPFFGIALSSDKSLLETAREAGCEAAGEAHFIIELEVNGKKTAMPIRFGLPAKGWNTYLYPAYMADQAKAQSFAETVYGALQNPNLSEHQRKAAEKSVQLIGSQEHYFFLYFLMEHIQPSGNNTISVRWFARDLQQPSAPVAGAILAECSIEYGAGASAKANSNPTAAAPTTAAPEDEILNKASISLIGDLQNLNALQNGDTFSDQLLLQFSADQPLQNLARELGCEAAGEAHFILSLSINGKTAHAPLRYGTPIKAYKSCAYLAFCLDSASATRNLQQLSTGNLLGDDDKKAFSIAYQTIGRAENMLFQQLLEQNLQVGANDITIRLSPRDLQRPSEVAPQKRAAAQYSAQLLYALPAHLAKILSPEQVAALSQAAETAFQQKDYDTAEALFRQILDGLGEESYTSPHKHYNDRIYAVQAHRRSDQMEAERAEREKAAAEQAAREQAERAAREQAERQHIIANLYQCPRIEDEGITSPFHQEHLRQILFSAEHKGSQFAQEFNIGDSIYAQAFAEKSLHNFLNDIGYDYSPTGFFLRISVEGYSPEKMPFWEEKLSVSAYDTYKTKTILDVAVSPSSQHLEVRENCGFFTQNGYEPISSVKSPMLYNFYYLPIGAHRISFELFLEVPADEHDRGIHTRLWRSKFGERIDIAKGSFTLHVDEAGREKLGKRLAITRRFPHSLPEIEADIMRLLPTYKLSDRFDYRILAINASSDWAYKRDEVWNHIVSRSVGCDVFVEYSNGARAIYYCTFKQEHLGNGKFSATIWDYSRFHDLYTKESIVEFID